MEVHVTIFIVSALFCHNVNGQNSTTNATEVQGRFAAIYGWTAWANCKDTSLCLRERYHTCTRSRTPRITCGNNNLKEQHINCVECTYPGQWIASSISNCEGPSCSNSIKTVTYQCSDQLSQRGCERRVTVFCNEVDLITVCDGAWSAWQEFSACSRSCNGGIQRRIRSCRKNNAESTNCAKNIQAYKSFQLNHPCNTHSCNAVTSSPSPARPMWRSWSECRCVGGVGIRYRLPTDIGSGTSAPDIAACDMNCAIPSRLTTISIEATTSSTSTASSTSTTPSSTTISSTTISSTTSTASSTTSTAGPNTEFNRVNVPRTPASTTSTTSTTSTVDRGDNSSPLSSWLDKVTIFVIGGIIILILVAVIVYLIMRKSRDRRKPIIVPVRSNSRDELVTYNAREVSNITNETESIYERMLPRSSNTERPLPDAPSFSRPSKPPRRNRPLSRPDLHSSFAEISTKLQPPTTPYEARSAPVSPSTRQSTKSAPHYSSLSKLNTYLKPIN